MGTTINTNLSVMRAFSVMSKVNAQTQKAQMNLSYGRKVNSVADDPSSYNVGKKLELQIIKQKAQLNNITAAKNQLSTAEAALQQVNDNFSKIGAKYIDSQDPMKDRISIASDIRTLASEIDSILKNTTINGNHLLANSDGTALTGSTLFDVGGNTLTADYASDSYLKVSDLEAIINGGNITGSGVSTITSRTFPIATFFDTPIYTGSNTSSTIKVTYDDGSSENFTISVNNNDTADDIGVSLLNGINSLTDAAATAKTDGTNNWMEIQAQNGKKITTLSTISGYDAASAWGIDKSASATGGLLATDDSDVISAAASISTGVAHVKSSLGRIGNLMQTLDSRSEFLTAAIANNTATISSLFDADVAEEQLNATKGNISQQIAMSVMSQLNTAPQKLLTLFN